ncbi:MAG: hypothetical protein FWG70_10385 [Oscillospiraceae bacterium]|nr:hypothetical protein [Oscillospiraceae bacterium]
MTFREAYINDMKSIRADEAVVNDILLKMRSESDKSAHLFKRIPVTQYAMAAAGIFILVAAAVVIPALLRGVPMLSELNTPRDSYSAELRADNSPSIEDSLIIPEENNIQQESAEYDYGADNDSAYDGYDVIPEPDFAPAPATAPESAAHVAAAPPAPAPAPSAAPDSGESAAEVAPDTDHAADHFAVNELYYSYYDYPTYKDWPDGSLWDSISDTLPVREYSITNYTPEIAAATGEGYTFVDSVDNERLLTNAATLSEFYDMFLSEQHRIRLVGYFYAFNNSGGVFDSADDGYGYFEFGEENTEISDVIYSLLSKWADNTPADIPDINNYTYPQPYGSINITIYNESQGLSIDIFPWDAVYVTAFTFTEGDYLGVFKTYAEEGTFEKLLSYLLSVE